MGRTKDLFIELREQEDFISGHVVICTLEPQDTVTTASKE
tara:strand:- start:3142 stop:3261 length:120 start_codon:yes stop_codon:yes gene_type:complete